MYVYQPPGAGIVFIWLAAPRKAADIYVSLCFGPIWLLPVTRLLAKAIYRTSSIYLRLSCLPLAVSYAHNHRVKPILAPQQETHRLDMPGGKRHLKETSKKGTARELREETGLKTKEFSEAYAPIQNSKHGGPRWLYLAPPALKRCVLSLRHHRGFLGIISVRRLIPQIPRVPMAPLEPRLLIYIYIYIYILYSTAICNALLWD
jgi:8-oxo-dGTP pyrophosphatase MutT (NUDIX family)